MTIDVSGNVYIADYNNYRVRKINTVGVISTIAGTGAGGFSGDDGAATSAQIDRPYEIAVDVSGNVYIAQYVNNRIRKINTSGIITTFAGTGIAGYSGDGGAANNAQISGPRGIAIDVSGNVYISCRLNDAIRKVNTSGIISTFAGTGVGGFSGDGGAATNAQLYDPHGVAVDASGNLYIADQSNNRIRKVNTLGIISTIAGTGVPGFSGDGGAATNAQLFDPIRVAVDPSNNVYISDNTNYRIREICANACLASINSLTEKSTGVLIFPNPNKNLFSLKIDNEIKNGELILINSVGQKVYEQKIIKGTNEINTNELSIGLYDCILLEDKQQISKSKLIIE